MGELDVLYILPLFMYYYSNTLITIFIYIDVFPADLAVLRRQVPIPPGYIRRHYRSDGHNSDHYRTYYRI